MKIALLLGQYLLQHKTMQLQGLGIFTIEPLPGRGDEKGRHKNTDDDIKFIPNKGITTNAELVEFIAKHTGKIKPLASSDLEDFLNIGKQLLNVSKQFYIEGLGTIILDGNDNLSFTQGAELLPAAIAEEPIAKKHADLIKDASLTTPSNISFENEPVAAKGKTARNLLMSLAIIVGVVFVGWLSYYFYTEWKNNKKKQANQEAILPVFQEPAPADSSSLTQKTDSLSSEPVTASGFKVVLETSGKNRAYRRYEDLQQWGYQVELATADSIQFQIITLVDKPLEDSTKVLDSLTRFFGRKAVLLR
ncbi:MAG: hypothetical protein KIT80_13745 [Chitinophagaceae bacterium]|nr:hypothetical protein [Chitinophagaceae bacterium]MCW5927973.1 hypothetical protein [Chitinophagaceae bacterium]